MRIKMQSALTALALLAVVGLVPVTEAQSLKIGVFDPGRVSEESAEAQRLQKDLAAVRDAKQAEIGAKEKVVTELRQKLEQQKLSLSPARRTLMEIDIQKRVLELNSAKELAGQQLQLEFNSAEARFNEKLRAVVDQFGADQGFSVILDVNAVAFASTAIDVTTPIVDLFNKTFPEQAAGSTP